MPIKEVKGGFKWGKSGHVYPTRAGAVRQAQAAYANGYREPSRPQVRVRPRGRG